MAKQAKLLNYRDLTFSTLKEKYSLALLGFATVAAVLLTLGYGVIIYSNKYMIPKQASKKMQIPAKAVAKFPTTYLVKEGDVLAAISVKMYGSDIYVEDIMKANGLYTPESLEIGKKLIIPEVTPKPSPGQIGTGLMTGQVQITSDTYTVQPGETLSDIALKVYGDNNAWTKIAQINNVADPNNIEEGTVLKIPKN